MRPVSFDFETTDEDVTTSLQTTIPIANYTVTKEMTITMRKHTTFTKFRWVVPNKVNCRTRQKIITVETGEESYRT